MTPPLSPSPFIRSHPSCDCAVFVAARLPSDIFSFFSRLNDPDPELCHPSAAKEQGLPGRGLGSVSDPSAAKEQGLLGRGLGSVSHPSAAKEQGLPGRGLGSVSHPSAAKEQGLPGRGLGSVSDPSAAKEQGLPGEDLARFRIRAAKEQGLPGRGLGSVSAVAHPACRLDDSAAAVSPARRILALKGARAESQNQLNHSRVSLNNCASRGGGGGGAL